MNGGKGSGGIPCGNMPGSGGPGGILAIGGPLRLRFGGVEEVAATPISLCPMAMGSVCLIM